MLEQLAAAPGQPPTSERLSREDLLYIGRAGSVEERIASEMQIPFAGIRVGGIRSLGVGTQVRNLGQMAQAAGEAGKQIAHFKPNAVLATGGYVSAPVLWAAWRKKIPIVIDLPDLEPGWAIRATWRLSKQVAVSFESVLKYFGPGRATVTGYPVRQEFFQATREAGQARFGLAANLPVVTVFGGSQGAHALNEAVRDVLWKLVQETQLIHICGAKDKPELKAARAKLEPEMAKRYSVHEYLKEGMALALAASDLVVARAGAATLGEFPAVGVPSVLVPGLFAEGHQEHNADFLATRGAAVKLNEADLGYGFLGTVLGLVKNEGQLGSMRKAVSSLAEPDAAKRIAEMVVGYAR